MPAQDVLVVGLGYVGLPLAVQAARAGFRVTGNPEFGLVNTPKIVGGVTASCADAAAGFYGRICDQVVRAKSAREAEMAKLLENTYWHVNIALVNEMAIFCRELDVDLRLMLDTRGVVPAAPHVEAL